MDTQLSLDDPSIFSPRLKFGWAKHHLRLIEKDLATFAKTQPYSIQTEDNLATGEYVVHIIAKGVPAPIILMFGDFISCLRSAMDQLVFQLVSSNGGRTSSATAFPIIELASGKGRETFSRATAGMDADAVRIIELLQPYHLGANYKTHTLWRLNKLWNIDKHRRIPAHFAGAEFQVGHPLDVQVVHSMTNYGCEMRFPLAAKNCVSFMPTVKLQVEFGDSNEGVSVNTSELKNLHEFVGIEVLAKFDRFFLRPSSP